MREQHSGPEEGKESYRGELLAAARINDKHDVWDGDGGLRDVGCLRRG